MIGNRFYKAMGVLMLALVICGFGMAAIDNDLNPLQLPALFHLHAFAYLAWFSLYIYQASLIGRDNRALHITLGKCSVLLVLVMLVTGWFMTKGSFAKGVSSVPGINVHQFISFPLFDLLGLIVFYGLALLQRSDAEFHKRAMLLALVAIMSPALARLGIAIGFPPFSVVANVFLVGAVIWHDRKVLGRVHMITWLGFSWIFIRLAFLFGVAATETWAEIAEALLG